MSAQTLEQLIDQQISLGHKDPHQIPDLLEKQLGEELLSIVKPYLADFISEMARHRMGNARRAAVAHITKTGLQDPHIMLKSMWVPAQEAGTIIYKRIADMTAEDFEARADYLDSMARSIHRSAQWCRDCATRMRHQGVTRAGDLDHLPPLPEDDA